jgi:hypothetical protein
MKVQESLVSTKKTTSGRMLGCYILCSESLVEVNRLMVEVEVDRQVKVEVDRQQVEGRGSRPGKFEVEDIDDKSTNKRSKCGCEMTD